MWKLGPLTVEYREAFVDELVLLHLPVTAMLWSTQGKLGE